MSHRAVTVTLAAALLVSAWLIPRTGVSAQGAAPQTPPRDVPVSPLTRRIPVGTGVVAGIVTTADTGRPIHGARVMLTGTGSVPAQALPAPRGQGAPAAGRGMPQGLSASLMASVMYTRTAVTDEQGRFSFDRISAGTVRLTVTRTSYLAVNYGQRAVGLPGTAVPIADGQRLNLQIALPRGAVITGTVFDADGEPASGVQVRVLRLIFTNGFKRWGSSGGGNTDDRGVYRISNLQPADYIISATASSAGDLGGDRALADEASFHDAVAAADRASGGAPVTVVTLPIQQGPFDLPNGYLPTYFPGVDALTSAARITVKAGEERSGVDIRVSPIRAGSISGTATGPLAPGVAVQVTAINEDPTADTSSQPSARANPNGQFTLRNLAPGRYTVMAQTVPGPVQMPVTGPNGVQAPPRLDDSQRLWASAVVNVESNTSTQLALALQTGRSVSGQLTYNMVRPPDPSGVRPSVTLTAAPSAVPLIFGGQPLQSQIGADGSFAINGVPPGRYIARAAGVGFLQSAMLNGVDTLDFPFVVTGDADVTGLVITMTDRRTQLGGTLTLATGQPGADYTIVVAPVDDRYWTPNSRRIAMSRTMPDGQFRFANLPAGEYMIAMVPDLQPGEQYDPDFLKTLAGASVRVTLAEGAQVTQDLRAAR